jgi:hypothetical protein
MYQQIKAWIAACAAHKVCQIRRLKHPKLLTRVLEINDSSCKLRETNNEAGEYVALSYCWGVEQPFKLTSARLESYKENIKVATLPKSIQDAIKVTRELGYRCLWVDSLCIIQDNYADKLREIGKMRQVYGDSSLTICATGARNCNEGFFDTARLPGTSSRTRDIGINYSCTLPVGNTGHVRLVERAKYNPEIEALNTRAWTSQEGLLPVSIVQFGACLAWECDELSERKTLISLTGGIDRNVPFSSLFVQEANTMHRMRRVLQ